MQPITRNLCKTLLVLSTTVFMAGIAGAQSPAYPTKPVRMIIALAPGGGVDTTGRYLAQKMSEAWGQNVVTDNRPGAGGSIASELVAKSPPDGYTMLMNSSGITITPSIMKLGYDPRKDLLPVSLAVVSPGVLVVHPSLPVKSVRELATLARAHPGQVNFAGSGSGSTPHLAAELFNTLANVKMVHVPYRGTGPAIAGLMSGEASVMFMPTTNAVPLVKSGRLRALAVTSAKRLTALPELATVAESGLKGYESSQWYGVLAPAGTPADILNTLNTHIAKIMQTPEMRQRMTDSGSVAVGSTREAFAAHLREEFAKWARVIKQSGAQVD
jgi:tripartite-type tricarboxylate transporter receptor subunit TctC